MYCMPEADLGGDGVGVEARAGFERHLRLELLIHIHIHIHIHNVDLHRFPSYAIKSHGCGCRWGIDGRHKFVQIGQFKAYRHCSGSD